MHSELQFTVYVGPKFYSMKPTVYLLLQRTSDGHKHSMCTEYRAPRAPGTAVPGTFTLEIHTPYHGTL